MEVRKKQVALLLLMSIVFVAMFSGCKENTTSESNLPPSGEVLSGGEPSYPEQFQNSNQTIEPSQTDKENRLPLITADMVGLDGMDKALFDGAVEFFGRQADDPERMTIPYIGIFGQYESDGKINVVCHVGLEHFCYNEEKTKLIPDGTIITYGKAVLTKNNEGAYTCDNFLLVGDGASEAHDLREFCGPLTELPDEIYDGKDYTSTFPDPKEMESMYTQETGIKIR